MWILEVEEYIDKRCEFVTRKIIYDCEINSSVDFGSGEFKIFLLAVGFQGDSSMLKLTNDFTKEDGSFHLYGDLIDPSPLSSQGYGRWVLREA